MLYMLDTDICSYLIKGCSEELLLNLNKHSNDAICISSITYAELLFGAIRVNSKKIKNKILYEEVIKLPIIKKIFDENYISLFKKIYYKNKKYINFIYDDKNYIIHFSQKVKTFDDLLDKIKKE